MSKHRITLMLCLSLLASLSIGQMAGGGMAPPEFHAEKAAGIFYYDADQVIKKMKITDEQDKLKVIEALFAYNGKMSELSTENAPVFRELENEFNRNVKIAMQNRDRSQMDGVREKIKGTIPPIKMQVFEVEKVLNNTMRLILSDKQNKKWLKYQGRKKG
ncbi:MAG: hypothetical protein AAGA10_01005 [Bacteroidota bacterium]